jgi:hypothetical protein
MVKIKSIPKKKNHQQVDRAFVQLPSRYSDGQKSQIPGLSQAECVQPKEPPKKLKTPRRRNKSVNQKKRKKKTKAETLASVNASEGVIKDVLEVECSLAFLDDGTLDPHSVPVLYCHPSVNADQSDHFIKQHASHGHVRLLRWDHGSNIRVIVINAETGTTEEPHERKDPFCVAVEPIRIKTAKGAAALLELCLQLQIDIDNSKMRTITKLQNIALAVEKGLFRLMIDPWSNDTDSAGQLGYKVTLWLADWAFDQCSPAAINVQNNTKATAFQNAKLLNDALADIFPDEAELLPLSRERRKQSISAKDVYELVDNVKLIEVLNRKKPPPQTRDGFGDHNDGQLVIPGLLPKLRPYQEAAVKWMLEREMGDASRSHAGANRTNGSEWELAWVIVKQSMAPNSIPTIHFLPEYTKHSPRRELKRASHNHFLFCPYTGWLAKSVEEARDLTLRSIGRPEHQSCNGVSDAKGGILAERCVRTSRLFDGTSCRQYRKNFYVNNAPRQS